MPSELDLTELTVAASPEAATVPSEALPLRDIVLSGRFFGLGKSDPIERLAEFATVREAASLTDWFGADHLRRLTTHPDGLRCALDRDIAAIDALLGTQLDEILHHTRLRRLEGSWRGLAWLTEGIDPGNRVKVRVMNVGWAEICRDLERAAEFDQSHLFRKIYEDEFGTPGGEPFGLMIIDHEVRHRPGPGSPTDDVSALKLLSAVSAAAFMPTILSASPVLLEIDDFADLATVSDPAAPFRTTDYLRWRGLFTQEDIRFIGVTLPRVLARPPWRDDPARSDFFRYQEYAPTSNERVWMTAGYAFGAVTVRAFATFAWPADVRGVEIDRVGGGLVDALPVESFTTDPDHVWNRASLDIVLTDRQERSLVDVGLMPLSGIATTDEAVFGSVRSLQMPPQYIGANATAAAANARLSTQINTLLCVSRFAHNLKMMGRNMVGSFRTADEIERQLQAWLIKHVNANISGGSDLRARYPLVGGRVTIREKPGKPGVFVCVIQMQPHYQLDDVAASFRLVTDIAGPGTGR